MVFCGIWITAFDYFLTVHNTVVQSLTCREGLFCECDAMHNTMVQSLTCREGLFSECNAMYWIDCAWMFLQAKVTVEITMERALTSAFRRQHLRDIRVRVRTATESTLIGWTPTGGLVLQLHVSTVGELVSYFGTDLHFLINCSRIYLLLWLMDVLVSNTKSKANPLNVIKLFCCKTIWPSLIKTFSYESHHLSMFLAVLCVEKHLKYYVCMHLRLFVVRICLQLRCRLSQQCPRQRMCRQQRWTVVCTTVLTSQRWLRPLLHSHRLLCPAQAQWTSMKRYPSRTPSGFTLASVLQHSSQ